MPEGPLPKETQRERERGESSSSVRLLEPSDAIGSWQQCDLRISWLLRLQLQRSGGQFVVSQAENKQ